MDLTWCIYIIHSLIIFRGYILSVWYLSSMYIRTSFAKSGNRLKSFKMFEFSCNFENNISFVNKPENKMFYTLLHGYKILFVFILNVIIFKFAYLYSYFFKKSCNFTLYLFIQINLITLKQHASSNRLHCRYNIFHTII